MQNRSVIYNCAPETSGTTDDQSSNAAQYITFNLYDNCKLKKVNYAWQIFLNV